MMVPICVRCKSRLRCIKNDKQVLSGGKLYLGDEWSCYYDDYSVVIGFGVGFDAAGHTLDRDIINLDEAAESRHG